MGFDTEQELFWVGKFGDDYIERNKSQKLLASNISFFTKALCCADSVGSVLELGSNIGMNLRALEYLYPSQEKTAIEINPKAVGELKANLPNVRVINDSILNFNTKKRFDLVFTKGVLIHINPDKLKVVYKKMFDFSKKYILVAEYFNPSPVVVNYRNHEDKLFKRDFCGELMDCYSNLRLLDYGFVYKRDNNFPQDNINWFLLEK